MSTNGITPRLSRHRPTSDILLFSRRLTLVHVHESNKIPLDFPFPLFFTLMMVCLSTSRRLTSVYVRGFDDDPPPGLDWAWA